MRTWLAALTACTLALVAATGCQDNDGLLSPNETRELIRAYAKWRASPVRNAYSYETRQVCFCPPDVFRWHRVSVRNDSIVEVRDVASGQVIPRERYSFLTVDGLFGVIAREPDEYAADISVTFDPTLGFPTRIDLTGKPIIADYGLAIEARDVRPLTP